MLCYVQFIMFTSHLCPLERRHFWSSGNQDIFGLYYFWTSILLMYCNLVIQGEVRGEAIRLTDTETSTIL